MSRYFKSLLFFMHIAYSSLASAGLLNHPEKLKQQLAKAYRSQVGTYPLRTQHYCNTSPCYTNRLILEQSPYLLQHAHNPVDWYAWGKEALDRAKAENKPIFLSIGYAACHWCHVMEKESFDNLQIAEILNKHFISIKVDREQRPDIDELYGHAVMIFQGQQGWPMSVFLTPDARPFFGGGYYTASDFKDILLKMSTQWSNHQADTQRKAEKLIHQIQRSGSSRELSLENYAAFRKHAIKRLLSITDNYQGGFGEGEKFPREPWLYLLLDDSLGQSPNEDSFQTLQLTLTKMAQGGIYDQLAGGFHRYATDPYWKVPHFEKMLYNQALLIPLYLQANRIKPKPYFQRVARQTAGFILQNLRDKRGGFYASMDADTEGEEGRYYLWHLKDWNKHLSQKDQDFISELYDVDEYGETDNAGNTLYLAYSLEEYAEYKKLEMHTLLNHVDKIHRHLLSVRNTRVKPAIDKKIIMGWNALAISALADASLYLDNDKYLQAATKAANFIWSEMRMAKKNTAIKDMNIKITNKIMRRIYYQGKASQAAQLADYAYYLQALIKLYDVEQKKHWLNRAIILTGEMFDYFWDGKQGGFYNVVKDESAPLPIRSKFAFDKTLVSANAIAAQMLIRLYKRTGNKDYRNKAQASLSGFAPAVADIPSAYSGLLVAAHELESGESSLPLYAARGHIRADAVIRAIKKNKSGTGSNYRLQIKLAIENGWHINSNTPLDKALIATSISLEENSPWGLSPIEYPQQQLTKLGYSDTKLALYQGEFTIQSVLTKLKTGAKPVIRLKLQACNDQLCLAPEELRLIPRTLPEY